MTTLEYYLLMEKLEKKEKDYSMSKGVQKMGMTIYNSCEPKSMSKEEIVDTLKAMVFGVQAFERFNAKERETLDKAWNLIDQYETRLKADMVAMLEELKSEFEHYEPKWVENDEQAVSSCRTWEDLDEIIQQKINSLKAENESQKREDNNAEVN